MQRPYHLPVTSERQDGVVLKAVIYSSNTYTESNRFWMETHGVEKDDTRKKREKCSEVFFLASAVPEDVLAIYKDTGQR